jgi:hypothetical protein
MLRIGRVEGFVRDSQKQSPVWYTFGAYLGRQREADGESGRQIGNPRDAENGSRE